MSYPHIPFRDCTRNTHPPFYRRQACRDFDTPYVVLTSFISLAFMQAQKARSFSCSSSSHEACFVGTLISNDLHASREFVNDTTYTTQSDYYDHVFHLHSTASCDESLPPELQVHVQDTAHRTDAQKHTYHVSSSIHDHNGVWFAYLY